MANEFSSQWILITGASKGLGKELALEFADAGGNLVLAARNGQLLDEVKREVQQRGVECLTVAGDITDGAVLRDVVALGLDKEVNVLVNNAGIVSIDLLEDVAVEEIDHLIQLNLLAPIKLTHALLPLLKDRKSGTIINVISAGAKKPVLHHAVYCASKYGLLGFNETLKLELKGYGIRVLSVCPGKMATELFNAAGRPMDTAAFIPPKEIAAAVLYMLRMSAKCAPVELAVDRMGQA